MPANLENSAVATGLEKVSLRSPPGSSVHEIVQARILEWVAMPSSRGSSWPRDRTPVSCIANRFLPLSQWKSHENHEIRNFCCFKSPVYTYGEALYSQQKQDGADCGSDHELLIAKFRLKLKKVGKPTRPFRDDLNQILYNYTVEVRNRFKGLDLIDRVPEELWKEVHDTI